MRATESPEALRDSCQHLEAGVIGKWNILSKSHLIAENFDKVALNVGVLGYLKVLRNSRGILSYGSMVISIVHIIIGPVCRAAVCILIRNRDWCDMRRAERTSAVQSADTYWEDTAVASE